LDELRKIDVSKEFLEVSSCFANFLTGSYVVTVGMSENWRLLSHCSKSSYHLVSIGLILEWSHLIW